MRIGAAAVERAKGHVELPLESDGDGPALYTLFLRDPRLMGYASNYVSEGTRFQSIRRLIQGWTHFLGEVDQVKWRASIRAANPDRNIFYHKLEQWYA